MYPVLQDCVSLENDRTSANKTKNVLCNPLCTLVTDQSSAGCLTNVIQMSPQLINIPHRIVIDRLL